MTTALASLLANIAATDTDTDDRPTTVDDLFAPAPVATPPAAPAPVAAAPAPVVPTSTDPAPVATDPAKPAKLTGNAAKQAVNQAIALANATPGGGPTPPVPSFSAAPAPAPAPAPAQPARPPAPALIRPNGRPHHQRLIDGRPEADVYATLRTHQLHPLLEGQPGTGKTSGVEAVFWDQPGGLFTVNCHADMTAADFVGTWGQNPDGTYGWSDGPGVLAMQAGGVLLVDDITLCPGNVLARFLFPAMDGRNQVTITEHQGETITAQPGFLVVGAHNPGVPGAVLSDALKSRFSVIIHVDTDYTLADDMGIDRRAIDLAQQLEHKRVRTEVTFAPQMRELVAFQNVADALGINAAIANLINHIPDEDLDQALAVVHTFFPDAAPLAVAGRA